MTFLNPTSLIQSPIITAIEHIYQQTAPMIVPVHDRTKSLQSDDLFLGNPMSFGGELLKNGKETQSLP